MRAMLALSAMFALLLVSAPAVAEGRSCDAHELFLQTSADILFEYSRCVTERATPENAKALSHRHLAITDIRTKASSYALINKVAFWISVVLAIATLGWPIFCAWRKSTMSNQDSSLWVLSPIVQTTIIAIAIFAFGFYGHYKERQTQAESLMRQVIFANAFDTELAAHVTTSLSRIDRGFDFLGGVGVGEQTGGLSDDK